MGHDDTDFYMGTICAWGLRNIDTLISVEPVYTNSFAYVILSEALVAKWLPSLKMNMTTQVRILDEAVCFSQCLNTFGKGVRPTILLPAMGKIIEKTGIFNLGKATSLVEWKFWIKTC